LHNLVPCGLAVSETNVRLVRARWRFAYSRRVQVGVFVV
jgi:hypothetical protein